MASNGKTTKQTAKKLNLKDRITDDSLDLNLSSLETVPVKDILEFPKVRKLNLSYNLLVTLPDDFIKLQLIRELDLSKNKLVSLPKNFGCMVNLKSLDLLGNELTMLPTSFGELKSLQWLDLKDNPLKPALRQAAGDCFNEAQCKKCATNVINFMKNVAVEEERQRQVDLKKKREEEAKIEAAEREKAKQLKAIKDQEREQRRLINEQRKKELQATKKEESNGKRNASDETSSIDVKKPKKSNCHGIITTLSFLLFVSLLFVTIYLLLNNFCHGGNVEFRKALLENKYLFPLMDKVDHHACPVLIRNKPLVKNILKSFEF